MSADRPKVLIVDDGPNILELLSAYLAGTFRVVTAKNGARALDRLDESLDLISLHR